ncbi:MAG: Helix-turn-helix domain [Acidobacteriota bacterium]|nr:Helix-turn-helix domain [Acidobacteriota bacterium]
MGNARPRPQRLAEKLLLIRVMLGLSQTEMLKRLDVDDLIAYPQISRYETGTREPPLSILLRYARVANVYVDALIDDDLNLPERLPAEQKSEGSRLRGRSGTEKRRVKGKRVLN